MGEAREKDAEERDEPPTVEHGPGRRETRTYAIVAAPESVDPDGLWRDRKAVGMAISERKDSQGRAGIETRYCILSRRRTVREFAAAVRGHWGIETNPPWPWEVSFREEEHRVSRDPAPANPIVIRRFALGLLKRDERGRKGIVIKRIKGAANKEYREKLVFTC